MDSNKILKIFILFIVAATIIIYAIQPNESDPKSKHYNLETGLEEAKKQNKLILIDVYTDWCKWCKKMDADVYSNVEIAEYLKANFIFVKLNGEGNSKVNYNNRVVTEAVIVRQFGVDGFPTTIFLKSNGSLISLMPGYYPPDKFLIILKDIIKNN
jgi:thioredoxin-related protein